MNNIDSYFSRNRRQFLTTTVAGAIAALAGCSGDGETTSTSSTAQTSDSDSVETDTQNNHSTNQKNDSTKQGTGTTEESERNGYEDSSTSNNEQEVESALDNASYDWFELDEPNQQLNFPEDEISLDARGYDAIIRALNYISNNEETPSNKFTEDVEAVYVAFREGTVGTVTDTTAPTAESSENYSLDLVPVSEERENYESGGFSNTQLTNTGEHTQDVITRFLDENVTGASDVSEGMPQEYLDLVG